MGGLQIDVIVIDDMRLCRMQSGFWRILMFSGGF